MSELQLRLHPDPVLRKTCASITTFDARVAAMAEEMLQIMYDAPGRGLAAPQVGVTERMFVMDASWKEGTHSPRVVINPEVKWASDETEVAEEGCLSIPDTLCLVRRPMQIELHWQGPDGTPREAKMHGVEARIALHELDHLDGILCIDRQEGALT